MDPLLYRGPGWETLSATVWPNANRAYHFRLGWRGGAIFFMAEKWGRKTKSGEAWIFFVRFWSPFTPSLLEGFWEGFCTFCVFHHRPTPRASRPAPCVAASFRWEKCSALHGPTAGLPVAIARQGSRPLRPIHRSGGSFAERGSNCFPPRWPTTIQGTREGFPSIWASSIRS